MEEILLNGSLVEPGQDYGEPSEVGLPQDFFTRLINLIHKNGRVVKRLGVERYYRNIDPTGRIYGLTRFYPSGSDDRYSVCVYPKSPFLAMAVKKNDAIHDNQVWTVITIQLFPDSSYRRIRFASLNENLVIVDGQETPRYFRGADDLADSSTYNWGICGLERPHRVPNIDNEILALPVEDQVSDHGIFQLLIAFEYEDTDISATGPASVPFLTQWYGREAGVKGFNLDALPIGDELAAVVLARVQAKILGGRYKKYSDDPFSEVWKRGVVGAVEAETLADEFPWDGSLGTLSAEVKDPPAAKLAVAIRNVMALSGGKGPEIPGPFNQDDDTQEPFYEKYSFDHRAAIDITNTTSRTRTNATVEITLSWEEGEPNYIPYEQQTAGQDFFFTGADGVTPIGWVRADYSIIFDTVTFLLRLDELRAGSTERIYLYFNSSNGTGGEGNWKNVFRPGDNNRELVSRGHLAMVSCVEGRGDEDFTQGTGFDGSREHVTDFRNQFYGSPNQARWAVSGNGPPYGGNVSWDEGYDDEPFYEVQAGGGNITLIDSIHDFFAPGQIKFHWKSGAAFLWTLNTRLTLLSYSAGNEPGGLQLFLYRDDGISGENGAAGYYLGLATRSMATQDEVIKWLLLDELSDPFSGGPWITFSFSWDELTYPTINLAARWGNLAAEIKSESYENACYVLWESLETHVDPGWNWGGMGAVVLDEEAAIGFYAAYEMINRYATIDEIKEDWLRQDYYSTGPEIRVHEAEDVGERPDWSNKVAFSKRGSVHVFPPDQVRTIGEAGLSVLGMEEFKGNLVALRSDGVSRFQMQTDIGKYVHDKSFESVGKGAGLGAPWSLVKCAATISGQKLEALFWIDYQGQGVLMTEGGIQNITLPVESRIKALLTSQTQFQRITALYTGKHNGLWIGLPEVEHDELEVTADDPEPEWYADSVLRAALDEWTEFKGVPVPKWSELAAPDAITMLFPLGPGCQWEHERGDAGEVMFAQSRDSQTPNVYIYGERTSDKHKDDWSAGDAIVPVKADPVLQGNGRSSRWIAFLIRYMVDGGSRASTMDVVAKIRDGYTSTLNEVVSVTGYKDGYLKGLPLAKEQGDGLKIEMEEDSTDGLVELISLGYERVELTRGM